MKRIGISTRCLLLAAVFCCGAALMQAQATAGTAAAPREIPQRQTYANPAGTLEVLFQGGPVNTAQNPFFIPLGPTGRSCATCHQPENAMSLSTDHIRERYLATRGQDPLFDASDGANCPTLVRPGRYFEPDDPQNPHSLLLNYGLFRISAPWPPRVAGQPGQRPFPGSQRVTPEFIIEVLSDPTGCNNDPEFGMHSANPTISVFRRPAMSANLRFITTITELFGRPFDPVSLAWVEPDPETGDLMGGHIMADGRERTLLTQARNAAVNHHGMGELSTDLVQQLVAFENSIYAAQVFDNLAGNLTEGGARGGVDYLASQQAGLVQIDTDVFDEFESWLDDPNPARAAVARGARIFNRKQFMIRNVPGISDLQAINFGSFTNSCGNCHDTRGSGSESTAMPWRDIGTTGTHAASPQAPYLPTFRLTCKRGTNSRYSGRVVVTHDPGRALVTGRCEDIGKFRVSPLRGLASRAPYFVNGTAQSLEDVVDFYEDRFGMALTDQERLDLIAFLRAL